MKALALTLTVLMASCGGSAPPENSCVVDIYESPILDDRYHTNTRCNFPEEQKPAQSKEQYDKEFADAVADLLK